MKLKFVRFIVNHKLTERIFMRTKWFQNLVVKVAREVIEKDKE